MPVLEVEEDEKLWVPRPGGQTGFFNDYTHLFCALLGGWFAGKTWAGARKTADLHFYNALDDNEQPTFVKGLAIAQNYSLARTIIIPELIQAFDEMGLTHRFVADPKRYCFELPELGTHARPSEILIRSADAPETITGFTVGHVWGDEVARWKESPDNPVGDPRLQAMGRLRDPLAKFRQFNMTFTHEGDMTAVYRDFESEPKPNHKFYRGRTADNPTADGFAADLKVQLTGALADQYLEGNAASLTGGNVYDNFNAKDGGNIDPALVFDQSRPLQLAIDFNINPGCHVELGQYYADRDLATTLWEFHEARMDVKRFIGAFRRFIDDVLNKLPLRSDSSWRFPGVLELYGDASGGSGNAATGESCWQVLAAGLTEMGVPFSMAHVPASNPHVADRVMAVNCAFANAERAVRYKIHPRCERLVRDFKTLKWAGNELNKDDRKLSHASDADGYRIYQLLPIRRLKKLPTGQVGAF